MNEEKLLARASARRKQVLAQPSPGMQHETKLRKRKKASESTATPAIPAAEKSNSGPVQSEAGPLGLGDSTASTDAAVDGSVGELSRRMIQGLQYIFDALWFNFRKLFCSFWIETCVLCLVFIQSHPPFFYAVHEL